MFKLLGTKTTTTFTPCKDKQGNKFMIRKSWITKTGHVLNEIALSIPLARIEYKKLVTIHGRVRA